MNLSTWCSFLLAVTFFKMFIDIHSSLYLILNIEIGNQKRFPFREGNKFNFKCFHLCYLDWQARVLFSRWICAQVDVKFHFLVVSWILFLSKTLQSRRLENESWRMVSIFVELSFFGRSIFFLSLNTWNSSFRIQRYVTAKATNITKSMEKIKIKNVQQWSRDVWWSRDRSY